MKVLKRFLSRGNSDSDMISPPLPNLNSLATNSSRRSIQTAPPSSRGKTLPTKLVAGGSNGNNGRPAGASKRNQDKRQQKIQQFLNNNSLARRTWEETRSQTMSVPMTVATESSSSSSINSISDEDAMDASSTVVAVGELTVQEEQEKLERAGSSRRLSSSAVDDDKSMKKKKKKKRRSAEKKISWDATVEVDQSKRELTRQFRNPLPEWKQRQMAHRVHHCNVRKAEMEVFQKEYLDAAAAADDAPEDNNSATPCEIPVAQEIAVTPAAEGWFQRCDRDISAEYLQNIDLVFGNHGKNFSSAKSVDVFSTAGKVKGSNKSVASF